MDDEVVIIGDDGTEHVFPAGFDPQRAAAIVRGDTTSMSVPKATAATGVAVGAAKLAPAIVSGLHKVAGVAGKAAGGQIPGLGVRAPAAMAATALGQALHGDLSGAGVTAGGAVAMSQVPKVAAAVQSATKPAVNRFVRFAGQLLPVERIPAGPVMRGAQGLSRIAGKAGLPLTLAGGAYDTFNMIQESAKRLDDPNLDPRERQAILLALSGGFAQ
jgi:hypothetical protein